MPRKPIAEVHEFMRMYHVNLENYPTAEYAYQATEKEWRRRYGEKRYAGWESFRRSKSYYMHNHLLSK